MAEAIKPSDAQDVAVALRLGWAAAELRGRFWKRVREPSPGLLDPVLAKDHSLPLEDERSPLERLFEAEAVVRVLATQLGLDFPLSTLSNQTPPPNPGAGLADQAPPPTADPPASVRLMGFTKTLVARPAGATLAGGSSAMTAWDGFSEFLFAWDARIQDTLAAASFSQSAAYQLGRGLGEVAWNLDPSVADADDPHGWRFLLGPRRRKELERLLDRLMLYFGPLTVSGLKASLEAWGMVAQDNAITTRKDAEAHLVDQSHIWRNLLIGGQDPQSYVKPHARNQRMRGIELVLRTFWPQMLVALIGILAVAAGAYMLTQTEGDRPVGAVLGVLGSFGVTTATIVAKSKESVLQVFSRMRQLYYTDLVMAAVTRVPADGKARAQLSASHPAK